MLPFVALLPGFMPLGRIPPEPPVIPGRYDFSPPGQWVEIPRYNTITIDVYAAGGGGGAATIATGIVHATAGEPSYFNGPIQQYAYGGSGGLTGVQAPSWAAHGGGYGGNVIVGGGAAGGAASSYSFLQYAGQNGGNGGRVWSQFSLGDSGAPVPGQQYLMICGNGGAAGTTPSTGNVTGNPGSPGFAIMTWA